MNTFREIVKGVNVVLVALMAIALVIISAICFLVTADIVAPADIGPQGWIRDQFIELDALTDADRQIAIASTAAAFGLGLLLLIFESIPALMPPRLYGTGVSGQTVLIDRRTIKQMIEKSAIQTENVTTAEARLRDAAGGLNVRLKAGLVPDANITETGRRLESKIKDDLRDLAGVSIASVRLELEYKAVEGERASEKEHPTTV